MSQRQTHRRRHRHHWHRWSHSLPETRLCLQEQRAHIQHKHWQLDPLPFSCQRQKVTSGDPTTTLDSQAYTDLQISWASAWPLSLPGTLVWIPGHFTPLVLYLLGGPSWCSLQTCKVISHVLNTCRSSCAYWHRPSICLIPCHRSEVLLLASWSILNFADKYTCITHTLGLRMI